MKKNFNGKFLLSSLLLMIGLLIQNSSQAQRKRVTRIDCDGVPVRVGFDISGFHGVETKKIIDVVLIPSDEEKVEVEMSPGFKEHLEVKKKEGVLCFDLHPAGRLETSGNCHITAYVHFVDLRGISASEAADVSMKGVYDAGGNPFTIQLRGSSDMQGSLCGISNLNIQTSGASDLDLDLDRVTALKYLASGACDVKGSWCNIGQIIMDCSGSCDCSLSGNAEMLNMQTTGSADVSMGDFSVLRFVGTSSGASSFKIRVTDSFRAEASGSAEVYVAGSPKTTDFSTSGASAIKIR